jgi:hypothetical protein
MGRSLRPMAAAGKPLSAIHLQCGNEGALRDFHLAELPHALLAFLLLFQKLALTGDVTTITLRRHILDLLQKLYRLSEGHRKVLCVITMILRSK